MFTIREYIEQNGLSADPESRKDQITIGKHLRSLGYERHLVRIGKEVKRVWVRQSDRRNDKLVEELDAICNHVTKA